ncbi:MAG: DUF1722 domain-containing protein [Deltaproteobacteria bacterium]|nr:DUF1722 domain-containing protein [Deltaproteobacteria bacterium]
MEAVELDRLKERWSQDEYLVLERSPETHGRIAALLKDPSAAADLQAEVGSLLAQGLAQIPTPQTRRQAALAIWEQLKERAPAQHALQAEELIGRLAEDPWAIVYLKKLFKILAAQQGLKKLLQSSYLTD